MTSSSSATPVPAPAPTGTASDTPNDNFNVYNDLDPTFWTKYNRGRPHIPDHFLNRIFNYHSAHRGDFAVVHEAGAGPGVLSSRLREHFAKVLVSDVGAKNLEFARRQLGGEEKGFVYRTLKLEDSVDAVLEETEGKQGVDMVFAATMIHFCDIDRALSAVAKQLKPGGTFAALATGRFVMDDERARGLWEDLLNANLWVILERRGGEDSGVMGIVDVAASAYDAIPLPEEYFEAGSRKRVKVNFGMDEGIKGTLYRCMVPPELREKHPLVSRVTEAEVVEWVDEDEGWRESKGIDEIRENLESLTVDLGAEKVKDIWEELVKVVGDRKMEGRWLAWCLLATKRTET